MGNFAKLTVLFFAFLLSFSISKDHYGELLHEQDSSGGKSSSQSYISENKLSKIFGLHQANEIVVNSVNHLPAPASKIFQDYLGGDLFYFEERIQSLASRYLKSARKIPWSLTIRDIIFPFHFFW